MKRVSSLALPLGKEVQEARRRWRRAGKEVPPLSKA